MKLKMAMRCDAALQNLVHLAYHPLNWPREYHISRVCSVRYVPRRTAVYTADITGTGHFVKFGTTSIPVPDTSASSVRYQYRYRILRYVRYDINTGTSGTGMDVCTEVGAGIGTTSIPVPDASRTLR